jgi:hypothetical protein
MATTDLTKPGPKITISCEAGHESKLTFLDGESPVYLDALCDTLKSMTNGELHGGCNWVEPEDPDAKKCGAKVDVTWRDEEPDAPPADESAD